MTVVGRAHEIVKASVVGIAGNLVLVAVKLVVGFASHSIAIVLDAVNNATDCLSSVVTIIGTRLSMRKPDRRHPFGYGRVEYLSSVVIAVIIIAAGVVSLRESIGKILHPGTPSYSDVAIAVIVAAVAAKVALGIWFKHAGERCQSEALIASGVDSNYDAVLSAGTLVVAFAQNVWDLNIDGAVGLVISLIVCKAGIEVLRDALGPIIGQPDDERMVRRIEKYVEEYPRVCGVCDIVLDDFGPTQRLGLMHVEVPEDMTARQIHELTRSMARGLERDFGINAMIGIYAENASGEFAGMRDFLVRQAEADPRILRTHGFYVDAERKTCFFDLVLDFGVDEESAVDHMVAAMSERYPDYAFNVLADHDYEDEGSAESKR